MNICKLVLEYIEQYPEDEPIFIEDIKKYVIQHKTVKIKHFKIQFINKSIY